MAINRNSYKSLVESVNEAVASTRPSTTSNSTDSTSNSWGGSNVHGAMNAYDLANILNQMMQGGAKSPSAPTVSAAPKSSKNLSSTNRASVRGGKSAVSRPTSRRISVATVKEALEILGEAQGWGSAAYGGANNAMELARFLNSQQGGGSPSLSTPKKPGGSRNLRRSGAASTSNIGNTAYSGGSTSKAPASVVAEEEDWDILDEILAEGLELYGEDGLEEILAHFAETGEMSQELADLLGE